jgi:hypothetical protein
MGVVVAHGVCSPVCQDGTEMTDALTARLKELLSLTHSRCDCPTCDVAAYQRLLSEHLVAAGAGYRLEHLRAAWEKPTPRRPQMPLDER